MRRKTVTLTLALIGSAIATVAGVVSDRTLTGHLFAPAMAQSQNWLVGTWRLTSATQTDNGRIRDYLGTKPLGQVMFDADGHFSNILMRPDLPKFLSNNRNTGTADEIASVVKGSIAYFGTYRLSGDTLTLHVEASTFPNWLNTDQTRVVHLVENQLTLENAAASAGGGNVILMFTKM